MYEYNKLKGRIKELYKTQGEFAKTIGISTVGLSKKLNCEVGFSQKDIVLWCKLLHIPTSQIDKYFFA